jgi:hypothetical protein
LRPGEEAEDEYDDAGVAWPPGLPPPWRGGPGPGGFTYTDWGNTVKDSEFRERLFSTEKPEDCPGSHAFTTRGGYNLWQRCLKRSCSLPCYRLAGMRWGLILREAFRLYPALAPLHMVRLSPPPDLGVAGFKEDLAGVHLRLRRDQSRSGHGYDYFSALHWKHHRPHAHLLYRQEVTKAGFLAALGAARPGRYNHNHVHVEPIWCLPSAIGYVSWHRGVPDAEIELAPRDYVGRHFVCSRNFLPHPAEAFWPAVKDRWIEQAEERRRREAFEGGEGIPIVLRSPWAPGTGPKPAPRAAAAPAHPSAVHLRTAEDRAELDQFIEETLARGFDLDDTAVQESIIGLAEALGLVP